MAKPLSSLIAGLLQHPVIDRADQPVFLGDGNEDARCDQAFLRV